MELKDQNKIRGAKRSFHLTLVMNHFLEDRTACND